MNKYSFKKTLTDSIKNKIDHLSVCGFINTKGEIYPLGTDTKVLSSVFELFVRPILKEFCKQNNLILEEATTQNIYPDFTLINPKIKSHSNKIAIDVKTTYINAPGNRIRYTLGGYTSFIRTPTKNISYHFDEYYEHWVIGFVYTRLAKNKSAPFDIYNFQSISDIPLAYNNVNFFVEEKWKIAGDSAGSGNTTNIGSISSSDIDSFKNPSPIFKSESEFLEYWRNYEKRRQDREKSYSNIDEFRSWKINQTTSQTDPTDL